MTLRPRRSRQRERGTCMTRKHWVVGLLTLACIGTAIGAVAASAAPKQQKLTNVTLQLKWVTQAQFAGYYAALDKGYYKAAGLNVNIKIGGPSITPQLVVKGKQAHFRIDLRPQPVASPQP